jgi:hypothetical protein
VDLLEDKASKTKFGDILSSAKQQFLSLFTID